MRKQEAPPPEHDASSRRDVRPHVRTGEPGLLSTVEVELPDGRYLLVFSRLSPNASDA